VGQEIVYCFKCQKRIVSSDYAKGLAFQLDNNSCCSGCAVQVLDTLPPKAKEQLLGKMFKATQQRQSGSGSSNSPAGGSPAAGTRRIPVLPSPPRPASPPTSPAPLVLTLGALGVVAVVIVVMLPSGRSAPVDVPPPAIVKRPPPILPAPDPGPSSEEKRRSESAKGALAKAREYAASHPKDFDGQTQRWALALLEAERTGYEIEAKRELEKTQAAAKEAAAQELRDFEREVRTLLDRKEIKAALDAVSRRRSRPGMPEWASAAEALERDIQAAAERRFGELKDKALAARDRGAPQDVASVRGEIAGWGLPDYVAKFDAALERPWRALFDGRSFKNLSPGIENAWRIQDGMLIHDNAVDNAAMFTEFFGDGEIRVRFDATGVDQIGFKFRVHDGNYCQIWVRRRDAQPGIDHELVLSARGATASATLDGMPIPVEVQGKDQGAGMIQFNSLGGSFRLKSAEFRPAR